MENFNNGNDNICLSRSGEFTSNHRDQQHRSMLALQVLQSALVYVNPLLIQDILADDIWTHSSPTTTNEALTPLFWTHLAPTASEN